MDGLQTMVFNTFVWMQIFNSLNNRRLDNKFNVLEGIQRNWFFVGIFLIMVGGQTLIIFVGGQAFHVHHQLGYQWGVAIVLGAISIPIGIIIRLVPDEFAAKCCPAIIKRYANRKQKDDLVVTDEENPWQFNQGLMDIKEELAWLRKYKGGRLRSLKFAVAHPKELLLGSRSPSRSRASSEAPGTPHMDDAASQVSHSPAPPTPESRRRRNRSRSGSNVAFAGAAMAGIVAGSIGGWSPIERGRDDASQISRDRSKSDLSREVRRSAEVHPETRESDPVVVNDPLQSGSGNVNPPSQATNTTPAFGYGPFGDQPAADADAKKDEDKKP
jgi:Ca2+-transporting ATPase